MNYNNKSKQWNMENVNGYRKRYWIRDLIISMVGLETAIPLERFSADNVGKVVGWRGGGREGFSIFHCLLLLL